MYNESLFNRDTFLLEESDPMTICIGYDHEDKDGKEVRSTHEISYETLKKLNGGVPIWEELNWGFSVVIYAVSHNIVYCTVYQQVAETGFKKIENFVLNKFTPQHSGFLDSGKHKFVYCVFIKELGGIKRGIIL